MGLLLAFCALAPCQSDFDDEYPKKPWELDFKVVTKPTPFRQGKDLYIYFVSEVKNNHTGRVPNILNFSLYTELGRGYLSAAERLELEKYKRLYGESEISKRPYQSERFGTVYYNLFYPDIEIDIVAYDAGMRSRNRAIMEDTLANFRKERKGYRCSVHNLLILDDPGQCRICDVKMDRVNIKGMYLSPRELRQINFIDAGQALHCIAIFKLRDPGAQLLDVQVSGLKSPVAVKTITTSGAEVLEENKVLHLIYEFPGEAHSRESDFVSFVEKKWDVKKVGPTVTKDQLDSLLEVLVKAYKLETEWKEKNLEEAALEKLRVAEGVTGIDVKVIFRVFGVATGVDFGFDSKGGILANKDALIRLQEWWIKNQPKLRYDFVKNVYVVDESPAK